jgi:benzoylformate decarboxylase
MRGKQVLMDTLLAHGVEYLFGNPGTTESPILDSLLDYEQLRYIVALHEGVALGAASYYAHASGQTGVVNLHVAPGLGNALGMLYNAFRARTPLVVTAGQQDTRLRLRSPVLGHDLVAMAAPLTKWSVQVERADEFALLLHRAFKVASDPPAGPVFVALPIDVLEQETDVEPFTPGALFRAPAPDLAGVEAAAQRLVASRRPAIVIGDETSDATAEVIALAERVGAPVWCEAQRLHTGLPTAHPNFRLGLPFDTAAIRKTFEGHDTVLLVGGAFFEEVWHASGLPFPAGTVVIHVERAAERLAHNFPVTLGIVGNARGTLRALLAAVERGATPALSDAAKRRNEALVALKAQDADAQRTRAAKRWDKSPISMPRFMAEIEAALPTDAIVVDESITASLDLARTVQFERTGDYFGTRGGGIGQALPGALGVKLAHPGRPVVAISGDGSAMYSIQALWTAAHHDLAVVFVIMSNREYRILKHNMDTYRQRFGAKPERGYLHMDLTAPDLGFVDIARGLGVEGTRVTQPGELRPALEKALATGRPYLLDVSIEGRA